MRWQTGVLAETPQRLPRAHGAESGDFLQRGWIVQAALQPIAQPLPGLLIEDAMWLADAQGRAHLQQVGQRLPERLLLSQSRAAQHRRMKALQVLRQQRVTQAAGGQARRALATVTQGPTGFIQPGGIEGHYPDAVTLAIQAGAVMNPFRRHQQYVPRSDMPALTAIGVAMLSLYQQADVVLQVKVPGKGEATVLGIDQAHAGQAALDMSDLVHGAYCSAMDQANLG